MSDKAATAILTAIRGFEKCRTAHEVGQAVARALAPLGLTTYAIGGMPPPSDPNPTPFTVHNWPLEWERTYLDQGFGAVDPIPRMAMTRALPFTISDLRSGRLGPAPGPEADGYFAAARALGRDHGLVVPIHGPFGAHGLAVFAGPGPDPAPDLRPLLQSLGTYAYARMMALFARQPPDGTGPALTPREAEVLRLARSGRGDEEIARTIGIAVRTVRFHFENARRRLGARTRAEALVLAVNHHLLGA